MINEWYIIFENNLFAILGWVIALGALIWVPFRRSAEEARTWLLIFFIFPWLALFIYWLIGRPLHAKKRRDRIKNLPTIFEHAIKSGGIEKHHVTSSFNDDNDSIARLVSGLGQFPAVDNNSLDLLTHYYEVYDQIIEDINKAQHHIHLEFFIFFDDPVGDRIMTALEQASIRGVSCRLLIDALGSFGSVYKIKRRLHKSGIEVHDILPLQRRWNSSRVDLRNHRKIIVIDGQIGYTGSQNIWDPAAHSRQTNQELFVRINGSLVTELQAVFLADWYLETNVKLTDPNLFMRPTNSGTETAQVLASGPDYPSGGVDLIFARAMHNASDEITIVTPYFIPNGAVLSAIRSAILSGVKICLIVPNKSDHILTGLAQRSYYAELLNIGVHIFLFEPNFLHAKHLRVDDELSIIGSSNMDLRSFELNAEIDVICFGKDVSNRLKIIESKYLEQCQQLDLENWQNRSIIIKILENSARLMSDLI